jgi:uncharacterized protein with NRDE domain
MCLIFISIEAHPKYPLLIAANRDEFYDRPSAPASFWPEAPQLLAGRDLRAGGTWLGITKTGRIAALTNYRDPQSNRTDAPSRGALVSDFLLCQDEPVSYLKQIDADARRYNGFNLLVGQGSKFFYYSNRAKEILALGPGVHGLSNHLLDTPWPKVENGKAALKNLLAQESIRPEELFHFLHDREFAADKFLPDTGVGLETERMLSPIFISSPGYGTRSSTVILLDRTGCLTFVEKSFGSPAESSSTNQHSFMLDPELH